MKGATVQTHATRGASAADELLARFHEVRDFTLGLTSGLAPEDCVVQSMPDVSPTKWHLAHTTWFFETFVLKQWLPGYRSQIPEYAYLFNSYYNAAGDMHRRDLRGLIARPTVAQAHRYRALIDEEIDRLLSSADDRLFLEIEPVLTLGIHHEQQHQELLLTDIKHVFAQNPLFPVYRERKIDNREAAHVPQQFIEFDESTIAIGHDGDGFAYDNESPRHRALILPFALANRPVTNAEFLEFIEDNGYSRPEFWLSLGWATINEQRWRAPLYWMERDGEWWNFTLSGLRQINPDEPVTHISYFEADAYANWAGARLATEFEWERAAADVPVDGNFVESETFHPQPWHRHPADDHGLEAHAMKQDRHLHQIFGDVWEWTRSAYSPYPGYRAAPGALGEYNGKFMCNQYVLRGGSCATSRTHIRKTYRNFFQPEKRWQFTGIRLARDLS
ncbi:MAG TPA: ergothioneine biosynthesis protein EgtB [Chthoniobacterales bacterium]|nr:ergothioneine biosynthesis protein EgtB [Chthoniobacterales bacterium]